MSSSVVSPLLKRETEGGAGRRAVVLSAEHIRRTRFAFFGICCYLASQAVQIPVFAFGPSWAVWPTLSDFAVAVLLVGYAAGGWRNGMISKANRDVWRGLLLVLGGTVVAFVLATFRSAALEIGASERAVVFGTYQIYRLAEFVLVFRVAASVPLSEGRLRVLSRIVEGALFVVFAALIGTYTSVLDTRLLVRHLPQGLETAGPWFHLALAQHIGASTIGYNHAYTALQLMMLTALGLSLRAGGKTILSGPLVLPAAVGVFLSGSRAGLAAMLFFLAAHFYRRPAAIITACLLAALLLALYAGLGGTWGRQIYETADRQLTLRQPFESDNLSGRQDIWEASFDFLQQDPVRWIVGAGPGSAAQQGSNAHMCFLQIVMETGVIGLIVFGFVMFTIITHLRALGADAEPLLWVTIAFLISSLTQETFYPVPAHGHFLGLYACSLGMILALGSVRNSLRRSEAFEEEAA